MHSAFKWVLIILLISPFFYLFIFYEPLESLFLVSAPFLFGALYIFGFINKFIDLTWIADRHIACEFWCFPSDFIGFIGLYIPWALLLIIIFGPLLYFTRKK